MTSEYGRAELGDLISKPGPDDVPLKPGETYTFTIHPGEVWGWEMAIRDGAHPQPTGYIPGDKLRRWDGFVYFGWTSVSTPTQAIRTLSYCSQ